MPGPQVLPEATLPSVPLLDMAAAVVAQTKATVHRLHKVLVDIFMVLVAAEVIRIHHGVVQLDSTALKVMLYADQPQLFGAMAVLDLVVVEITRPAAAAAALEPMVERAQHLLVHLPKLAVTVERVFQVG
jgi:hypothetical protein